MLTDTFWITFSILIALMGLISLAICRHAERRSESGPFSHLFFGVFTVAALFTIASLAAQTSSWILPALTLAGMSIGGTLHGSNEAVPRTCP